jgi:hypothetical protein
VTSSYSDHQCVGVAQATDAVGVADSKEDYSRVVAATPAAWTAFLTSVKDGKK